MAHPVAISDAQLLRRQLEDVSVVTVTPFGGDGVNLDGVARTRITWPTPAARDRRGDGRGRVGGLAETWAPFCWQAGARGFTSGLGNVAPALALALRDALRTGDLQEAMRLWRELLPFEQLRSRHREANDIAVVKAALDRVGLAGGPPQPPLSPLRDEDAAALEHILAAWGVV